MRLSDLPAQLEVGRTEDVQATEPKSKPPLILQDTELNSPGPAGGSWAERPERVLT